MDQPAIHDRICQIWLAEAHPDSGSLFEEKEEGIDEFSLNDPVTFRVFAFLPVRKTMHGL